MGRCGERVRGLGGTRGLGNGAPVVVSSQQSQSHVLGGRGWGGERQYLNLSLVLKTWRRKPQTHRWWALQLQNSALQSLEVECPTLSLGEGCRL